MCISITDNFLPDELYVECFNYAMSIYNSNDMVFKTNNIWNNNIVYDSSPILIHTIDNNHNLCKRIQKSMIDNLNLSDKNISFRDLHFYFYTPGSHIPWHDDGHYSGGITIYLNNEWNDNWGGAIIYKSKDSKMIDGGFYPKQNRGIILSNKIEHSVMPTTKSSNIRISIQCFFMTDDNK